MKNSTWRKLIVYGYLGFILFPFLYLFLLSFSGSWRFPNLLPEYFGLRNWAAIGSSESGLFTSLVLSLAISVAVASISTGLGFMVGRMISTHSQQRLFTVLTYFPYVLSPVIFGACLTYFFIKVGIFGQIGGVILAHIIVTFPYALVFFSSFWGQRTQAFEQLVQTLGGRTYDAFTRVFFPMGKGLILICFFQTFLISWFEYGLTSVIGVGKIQTLPIKVFLFIKEANFYYGALSCCLLIMPPVLFLYINKKYVFHHSF